MSILNGSLVVEAQQESFINKFKSYQEQSNAEKLADMVLKINYHLKLTYYIPSLFIPFSDRCFINSILPYIWAFNGSLPANVGYIS